MTLTISPLVKLFTALTVMYGVTNYVSDLRADKRLNDAIKLQNVNYKMYNDSLALAMQRSYSDEIAKYPNVISLDDITESFRIVSKENRKDFKIYADNKNTIQDSTHLQWFQQLYSTAYFVDDFDSTYQLYAFKISNDTTIIIRTPVKNIDFDNLNK